MNEICPSLDEILTAHRRGELSDSQREHARQCAACSDALLVEALLRAEGVRARADSAPPALERVAARLHERLERESERRERLVGLGLRLAGALLTLLASITAGVWGLRFYGAEARGWLASALTRLSASGGEVPAGLAPTALPLACAVFLAITFLSYSLWSSWAEE